MKIFRYFVLLVLLAFIGPGCATKGEQKPKKPAAITAPTQQATPPAKPKAPFLNKLLYYTNPLNLLPKKAKPPKALPPQLIGTVKMVNIADQYVLIDAMSQSVQPGDLLVCINGQQQQTANLRMGSLKNPPFLIADLASGTPAVGDRVFKP